MKKSFLLLLPFLFLFGCGGGDSTSSNAPDNNANENPDVIANAGTITVTFPAVQDAQKALIDTSVGNLTIRNGARLVVRKTENIVVKTEYPVLEVVCEDVYDAELDETYEECTTIYDYAHPIHTYADVETFRKVSDTALNPDGSGSASIDLLPGSYDSLEVLTFVSGEYYQGDCNGAQPPVCDGYLPFEKIAVDSPDADLINLHLMVDYGIWAVPFTVELDTAENLAVTLQPVSVNLSFSPADVDAGASYEVSYANKSAALGNQWYVRQALQEGVWDNPNESWFIREEGVAGESGTLAGSGQLTLQAPDATGFAAYGLYNPNQWTIWHHGQFFINSELLGNNELLTDWTFGTSDAGPLNPYGEVLVGL
jgi:hypothetical protein